MDKASKPTAGFSADTEILTRDGWKLFAKLDGTDEVASRTASGRFQWQMPTERRCDPFDGNLVQVRNKSISLAVAPGHDLLVRRLAVKNTPTGKFHNWHLRGAWYFADHPYARFEVPVVSWWTGVKPPADFELPGRPAVRRLPAHERATEWLASVLVNPWTPAGDVIDTAWRIGIFEKPLAGARRNLGVTVRRSKVGMGWEMSAPTRTWTPPENCSHMPCRGFRMPMKDFCAFLGIFLAEGWVVKGRPDIMVSQSPKSPALPEIREILESTGLRWCYDPPRRKFTTQHTVLSEWLGENAGHRAWNKHVPPGFKDYPPKILDALFHAMCLGDGGEAPLGQRRYHTTSAQLADDAQEIFQKLGMDSWIRVGKIGGPSKLVPGTNRHIPYTAVERLRDVHLLPRPRRLEYHGNVYSLSVPNNLVYVRRNGRAVWAPST